MKSAPLLSQQRGFLDKLRIPIQMYRDSLSYSVLFLPFCVKNIIHQKGFSPVKVCRPLMKA